MATTIRRILPLIIDAVATFTDGIKRSLMGSAPTTAAASLVDGTGFTTSGQVVTTTATFTATANQYANCWLIAATQAPCLIVSHPAVSGAALALTVFGAAPTTSAGAFKILRAPTPAAALSIHYDRGEYTVTAANASSLATSLTLTKALIYAYGVHIADLLAHDAADSTNTVASTTDDVINLATAITAANQIKAAYNAHRAQSGVHPNDDSGHQTTSSDATDQSSLNTLLNELKSDFNAHIASGLSAPSLRVTDA